MLGFLTVDMLRKVIVLNINGMWIVKAKVEGIGPAPALLALSICNLDLLEGIIVVRLLVGAFTILVICRLVSVLVAEVGSLIIGRLS